MPVLGSPAGCHQGRDSGNFPGAPGRHPVGGIAAPALGLVGLERRPAVRPRRFALARSGGGSAVRRRVPPDLHRHDLHDPVARRHIPLHLSLRRGAGRPSVRSERADAHGSGDRIALRLCRSHGRLCRRASSSDQPRANRRRDDPAGGHRMGRDHGHHQSVQVLSSARTRSCSTSSAFPRSRYPSCRRRWARAASPVWTVPSWRRWPTRSSSSPSPAISRGSGW